MVTCYYTPISSSCSDDQLLLSVIVIIVIIVVIVVIVVVSVLPGSIYVFIFVFISLFILTLTLMPWLYYLHVPIKSLINSNKSVSRNHSNHSNDKVLLFCLYRLANMEADPNYFLLSLNLILAFSII